MRFKVINGFNAFYLLDTETDEEACLGDGVPRYESLLMVADWNGFDESTVPDLDDPRFVTGWEQELNWDWGETLAAYFPETCKREYE